MSWLRRPFPSKVTAAFSGPLAPSGPICRISLWHEAGDGADGHRYFPSFCQPTKQ